MNIETAKKMKREAEVRISTVIEEFMKETGVFVDHVGYRRDVEIGGPGRVLVDLEVRL
jgi:hypothetical protein